MEKAEPRSFEKWDKCKIEGKHYWRQAFYDKDTDRITRASTPAEKSPKATMKKKAQNKGPPSMAELLEMSNQDEKREDEALRVVQEMIESGDQETGHIYDFERTLKGESGPPLRPQNLFVEVFVGDNSAAVLKWDPADGNKLTVKKHIVEQLDDENGSKWESIGAGILNVQGNSCSKTIKSLDPDKRYKFRVYATNDKGKGAYSTLESWFSSGDAEKQASRKRKTDPTSAGKGKKGKVTDPLAGLVNHPIEIEDDLDGDWCLAVIVEYGSAGTGSISVNKDGLHKNVNIKEQYSYRPLSDPQQLVGESIRLKRNDLENAPRIKAKVSGYRPSTDKYELQFPEGTAGPKMMVFQLSSHDWYF